jgi:hypothetical protein
VTLSAPSGDSSADGDAGHDGRSLAVDRRLHCGEDGAGDAAQLSGLVAAGQKDSEFVAADPVRRSVRRDRREPRTDGFDQPVADGVTHGVVDRLEMIDVDQQQPEAGPGPARRLADRLVEAGPVRQAGQRVEIG